MTQEKRKLIDIDRIIQEKAGDKAQYVPEFLLKWLRNLMHQEELNAFMDECGDIEGVELSLIHI